MKSIASSLGRAILGTILCLLTMASPGWGGGSDDEAPDAHQDNGPSYFGWDLGIIKRTSFSETGNVEFRAEFFNVLNHPIFFVGNQNINSPNFGKITQTFSSPRVIQLALKVNW